MFDLQSHRQTCDSPPAEVLEWNVNFFNHNAFACKIFKWPGLECACFLHVLTVELWYSCHVILWSYWPSKVVVASCGFMFISWSTQSGRRTNISSLRAQQKSLLHRSHFNTYLDCNSLLSWHSKDRWNSQEVSNISRLQTTWTVRLLLRLRYKQRSDTNTVSFEWNWTNLGTGHLMLQVVTSKKNPSRNPYTASFFCALTFEAFASSSSTSFSSFSAQACVPLDCILRESQGFPQVAARSTGWQSFEDIFVLEVVCWLPFWDDA